MHVFVVMRGLPGSSKSTFASQLIQFAIDNNHTAIRYSTDDYWGPEYEFDITKLSMAHGWNFDRTYKAMRSGINIIVLDNTNTQLKEFVKYLLPARFYHYDICLLEPDVDWKYDVQACFEKNTHGVPRETIERMLARFESTDKLVKYLGIEDEQAKYTRILSQT